MSARDVIAAQIDEMEVMTTSQAHGSADLILSALSTAGYAVVPVQPTEAMNIAGRESRRGMGANVDVYQAMLAAAQEDAP